MAPRRGGRQCSLFENLEGDSPPARRYPPGFEADRPSARSVLAAEQADSAEAPYETNSIYVTLDSFRKVASSEIGQGAFTWNFMVQGDTGSEVMGISDTPDSVTQLEIGSFVMPVLPEVPYVLNTAPRPGQLFLGQNNTSAANFPPLLVRVGQTIGPAGAPYGFGQYPSVVIPEPNIYAPDPNGAGITPWINNPYTQLPFGNRMTVQVREAGRQGYIDRRGARHHFELVVAHSGSSGANPNHLQAAPATGGGTFSFPVPLIDLHGVTLVFRGPDQPIAFDPDVFYDAPVMLDAQAAPGPYVFFDIPVAGLNAGDRIFVEGLRSGSQVLDAYVNRAEGHAINHAPAAPFLPPSNPGLPIDAIYTDPAIGVFQLNPPPVPPPGGWRANIFIAKRRMRIPLRIIRGAHGRYPTQRAWNRE